MNKILVPCLMGLFSLSFGMAFADNPPEKAPASVDIRLQSALQRLKSGEDIAIAAIGGSLTTGFQANPASQNGWAALVNEWFQDRAKESGGSVYYLNRGVSGTDSAAGAMRVQAEILDEHPDIVFVEFAVNDQWLDPAVRPLSYEGVVRQILKAPEKPAAFLFYMSEKDTTHSMESEEAKIAAYYHLNSASYGATVKKAVRARETSLNSLYTGQETVHPNNQGHEYAAKAIIAVLQRVWDGLPAEKVSVPDADLPPPLVGDDFEFVADLGNTDIKPLENKGFATGSDEHGEWLAHGDSKRGWQATAPDAEISFKISGAKGIGLFYAESDQYRDLEAWVDNGPRVRLSCYVSYRAGYLGWAYRSIGAGLAPGEHVLHVKALKGSDPSKKYTGFVSIMLSGVKQ
jgi:lysophospholipase L1-like esterase